MLPPTKYEMWWKWRGWCNQPKGKRTETLSTNNEGCHFQGRRSAAVMGNEGLMRLQRRPGARADVNSSVTRPITPTISSRFFDAETLIFQSLTISEDVSANLFYVKRIHHGIRYHGGTCTVLHSKLGALRDFQKRLFTKILQELRARNWFLTIRKSYLCLSIQRYCVLLS